MPDLDLMSGLIATYRELNHRVRTQPNERLARASGGGQSVRELVRQMRDRELRFSQALKARITSGAALEQWSDEELPTLGLETDQDTAAMLIAQFGTARESTLAMLRDLPESDWDAPLAGDKTIRTRVFELLDADHRQMERITGALAAG